MRKTPAPYARSFRADTARFVKTLVRRNPEVGVADLHLHCAPAPRNMYMYATKMIFAPTFFGVGRDIFARTNAVGPIFRRPLDHPALLFSQNNTIHILRPR